jgi:hypothetical protein
VVVEVQDRLLLSVREPVVTGNAGVVLIGAAIALLPVIELTLGKPSPADDASDWEVREGCQVLDEVDDLVAGVMGSPEAVQGSPSSFFNATCSSEITAMT